MTTTNDAAERLPKPVEGLPPDLSSGQTLTEWECEQRVAAERRATVERYEPVLRGIANLAHLAWTSPDTVREAFELIEQKARAAILDAVAER